MLAQLCAEEIPSLRKYHRILKEDQRMVWAGRHHPIIHIPPSQAAPSSVPLAWNISRAGAATAIPQHPPAAVHSYQMYIVLKGC